MIHVQPLEFADLKGRARELELALPIEQTQVWAAYQDTIEGRSPWGAFEIFSDDKSLALVSFIQYQTHGYRYLVAAHGPVWREAPTPALEAEVADALVAHVHKRDRGLAFVRMATLSVPAASHKVLSTVPYDQTVIIDITGTPEDILSRMKTRGRRDVRKHLRESNAIHADETTLARANFAPYYALMQETATRDGFTPAPSSDYEDMLSILGPEHARVFASRVEGELVSWSIVTMCDGQGTRYYGASKTGSARTSATDVLVYFECQELAKLGCDRYDLMGIGSDFAPSLMGLNEFKTKFTKEITPVAPTRDFPIKVAFYQALVKARKVVVARREKAAAAAEKRLKNQPREDLMSIILGGDIGTYALAREFHEAYHITSHIIAQAPIAAIEHSRICHVHGVNALTPETVTPLVNQLANSAADKNVVVIGNTDALIALLNTCKPDFAANVICPIPSPEAVAQVSDKARFAELCAQFDLPTPQTEVVSLSAAEPPAPTKLAFPVVAKPARSSEYAHHMAHGFKKVYFVHEQATLDSLWADLKADGFTGDFLVQELIEGDDTYMDSLTIYLGTNGKPQVFAGAQVLLEDHAPSMLGNPVAMIVRQMPELWEKAAAMLQSISYTGFANFDIKRSPKDGRSLFLEVNPRIGRNSYYVCAGGVNPMRALVTDVVDGRGKRCFTADQEVLYTLVPTSLLLRYVREPELKKQVEALIAADKVVDPQRYAADKNFRRTLAVEMTEQNQIRKFNRYYPKPTDTSF